MHTFFTDLDFCIQRFEIFFRQTCDQFISQFSFGSLKLKIWFGDAGKFWLQFFISLLQLIQLTLQGQNMFYTSWKLCTNSFFILYPTSLSLTWSHKSKIIVPYFLWKFIHFILLLVVPRSSFFPHWHVIYFSNGHPRPLFILHISNNVTQ